jgi:hypothetical protein
MIVNINGLLKDVHTLRLAQALKNNHAKMQDGYPSRVKNTKETDRLLKKARQGRL